MSCHSVTYQMKALHNNLMASPVVGRKGTVQILISFSLRVLLFAFFWSIHLYAPPVCPALIIPSCRLRQLAWVKKRMLGHFRPARTRKGRQTTRGTSRPLITDSTCGGLFHVLLSKYTTVLSFVGCLLVFNVPATC